jgi:hypothetical protein
VRAPAKQSLCPQATHTYNIRPDTLRHIRIHIQAFSDSACARPPIRIDPARLGLPSGDTSAYQKPKRAAHPADIFLLPYGVRISHCSVRISQYSRLSAARQQATTANHPWTRRANSSIRPQPRPQSGSPRRADSQPSISPAAAPAVSTLVAPSSKDKDRQQCSARRRHSVLFLAALLHYYVLRLPGRFRTVSSTVCMYRPGSMPIPPSNPIHKSPPFSLHP